MRVESKGVLLGEDDIKPYFILKASKEDVRYYIFFKYLPYVLLLGRSRVTYTREASNDGV